MFEEINSQNILFIDNKNRNLKRTSKFLKNSTQYKIFFIDEDKKITKSIVENFIDLIIIDASVKINEGLNCCLNIRKDSRTKDIPIILLTPNNDIDVMVKGFTVGASDCVQKPFNSKILLARINTHIENKVLKESLYKDIQIKDNLLMQKSKMALMGEMIDTIIHQWNQPLTIIDMYRQSIKYELENLKIENEIIDIDLDGVSNQISFLEDTLKEFKNFFRPKKEIKNMKVENLFHSVEVLLKDMLIKHNIKLTISSSKEHKIFTSQNEIKHILVNLVNNAKDAFLENKEIKNREITLKSIDDKDSIKLQIIDNAGGIPNKIINKIFESEFTTKDNTKGTGIGLYISQMIASKNGAEIYVNNESNGAVFTVEFRK